MSPTAEREIQDALARSDDAPFPPIALGYEDLIDDDELRHDPVLAMLAGKLAARRADCPPLTGKSTLNRLELSRPELTRYAKLAADTQAIETLFVDLFLDAHAKSHRRSAAQVARGVTITGLRTERSKRAPATHWVKWRFPVSCHNDVGSVSVPNFGFPLAVIRRAGGIGRRCPKSDTRVAPGRCCPVRINLSAQGGANPLLLKTLRLSGEARNRVKSLAAPRSAALVAAPAVQIECAESCNSGGKGPTNS